MVTSRGEEKLCIQTCEPLFPMLLMQEELAFNYVQWLICRRKLKTNEVNRCMNIFLRRLSPILGKLELVTV